MLLVLGAETAATRNSYAHGVVTLKSKAKWMERQRMYLVPLIRRRQRVEEEVDIPSYIEQLFNHFCDQKSSVNLSCIRMEIEFMDQSLKEIMFKVPDAEEPAVDIETG